MTPLWMCLLAGVLFILLLGFQKAPEVPLLAFLVPILMMALGGWLFRKLLSGLMDEVWDNGHELIVVNEGHVEHVPLSSVVNISYSGLTNPKRATLQLRHPGRWGEKLSFIPPRNTVRLLSLTDNAMIDDLVRRVDEARQRP